jgi:hypothetical protein
MKYIQQDPMVRAASVELVRFFESHLNDIFYLKQLQVRFEKKYFHWVLANAVNELLENEFLKFYTLKLGKATKVKFIFHKSNRYYKRQIKNNLKIIEEYSNPTVATSNGREAENLFLLAFMEKRFVLHGRNMNKFGRRKWTRANHNLDFIIERDDIVYGCEVKNTFDYISKSELGIKLDICDHLKIRLLFIMRYAPKTYNFDIINRNGYAMIFETQIFPLASKDLVKKIKKELKMPVDYPMSIPDGIINRFMKWHTKNL